MKKGSKAENGTRARQEGFTESAGASPARPSLALQVEETWSDEASYEAGGAPALPVKAFGD